MRKVLEAVGHMPAYEKAYKIVRPGGVVSRVGVPQYENAPVGFTSLFGGTIDPGNVFDRTVGLDAVPDAHRAMDDREALKVMIAF